MVRRTRVALLTMVVAWAPASRGPVRTQPAKRAQHPAAVASPDLPLVRIVARDYAYELPDTLPAGFVRIRLVNRGAELHEAILTRLAPGETGAAHLASRDAWLRGGPFPGWSDDVGGVGGTPPGDSGEVVVRLKPGRYLVACYVPVPGGIPHFRRGMQREVRVTSGPGLASLVAPAADLTVQLVDYTFGLSAPITAGSHVIRVTNRGPQEHELEFARVLPGHTGREAVAWTQGHRKTSRRPFAPYGGMGFLAPHETAFLILSFSPGDYLLFCRVSDAVDRKPHVDHGMVYAVHVN